MGAIVEAQHERGLMPFAIRPLREGDILQSAEIEREAFPTLFPPTSFRRELKNRLAGYLVAVRNGVHEANEWRASQVSGEMEERARRGPFHTLVVDALNGWTGRNGETAQAEDFITGFVGTWYMADDAHIVSVGVRSGYRGRGIGELLLIAAIEQAMARRANVATLEVRPSNKIARNLYRKYGFTERGVRKAYYADNREDAIIMTTGPIQVTPYPERFRALKKVHQGNWGIAELCLF